jgi:hypothetical protein
MNDATNSKSKILTTPAEAADYIRDMTDELATIARCADLSALAYILDMGAQRLPALFSNRQALTPPPSPADANRDASTTLVLTRRGLPRATAAR